LESPDLYHWSHEDGTRLFQAGLAQALNTMKRGFLTSDAKPIPMDKQAPGGAPNKMIAPKAEAKKEAPTPEEKKEKEEVKIDAAKEAPKAEAKKDAPKPEEKKKKKK